MTTTRDTEPVAEARSTPHESFEDVQDRFWRGIHSMFQVDVPIVQPMKKQKFDPATTEKAKLEAAAAPTVEAAIEKIMLAMLSESVPNVEEAMRVEAMERAKQLKAEKKAVAKMTTITVSQIQKELDEEKAAHENTKMQLEEKAKEHDFDKKRKDDLIDEHRGYPKCPRR